MYNEAVLTADMRKLFANGYFQDIKRSITPSTTNPDKYDLKVDVDEKRSGSISLGGGVDTINGPFGNLGFSDSNFRGRGEVLTVTGQSGLGAFGSLTNTLNNGGTNFLPTQQTYNVEATFIEPNLFNTNTSMATSGLAGDLPSMLVDDAMQRTLGASVNFTKKLGPIST